MAADNKMLQLVHGRWVFCKHIVSIEQQVNEKREDSVNALMTNGNSITLYNSDCDEERDEFIRSLIDWLRPVGNDSTTVKILMYKYFYGKAKTLEDKAKVYRDKC